jgi:TonB family protein
MFETATVSRSAVPSRLLASIIIHVLAIVMLWQAKTTPRRFSGIQVVYAAETSPVWLPRTEPIDAPHGTPKTDLSEFRGGSGIPSDVPEHDEAPVATATSIPADIDALIRNVLTSEPFPQQVASARLGAIPRLAVDSVELPAAPPPAITEDVPKRDFANVSRVEPARLMKQTIPDYPPLARKARVEGTVILEADITESGALENVTVIEGHPMLIDAAIAAIRQWRYAPARLNGKPTRSSVRVTVNFRLKYQ